MKIDGSGQSGKTKPIKANFRKNEWVWSKKPRINTNGHEIKEPSREKAQ